MTLALNDKGWLEVPPRLTGEAEAKLTLLACGDPPPDHARPTLRLLANHMVEVGYIDEVSYLTVREWLNKTNLSLGVGGSGVSASLRPSMSSRWEISWMSTSGRMTRTARWSASYIGLTLPYRHGPEP